MWRKARCQGWFLDDISGLLGFPAERVCSTIAFPFFPPSFHACEYQHIPAANDVKLTLVNSDRH